MRNLRDTLQSSTSPSIPMPLSLSLSLFLSLSLSLTHTHTFSSSIEATSLSFLFKTLSWWWSFSFHGLFSMDDVSSHLFFFIFHYNSMVENHHWRTLLKLKDSTSIETSQASFHHSPSKLVGIHGTQMAKYLQVLFIFDTMSK